MITLEKSHTPETFWDREGSRFADVWTRVSRTLSYREDNNAAYHGDFHSAQNAQGHCANERIGVCEILLEGINRQQSQIRLLFCIAEQVDVNELPDLKIVGCHVLHHLGKKLGNVATFGYHLCILSKQLESRRVKPYSDQTFHGVEFLSIAVRVKLVVDILEPFLGGFEKL